MTYYRQCTLQKRQAGGRTGNQVAWLPEKFCQPGQVLQLFVNHAWDNGWTVTQVGPYRCGERQLPYVRGDIRNHREQTGDAEPK